MTLDESQRDAWRRKQEERAQKERVSGPAGGDGSGFAGLEIRVAKIETHLEHVRADLDRLRDVPIRIAIVEERITHLPTKSWMVGSLGTALAVIAALIAFSEKIHVLVH